MQQRSDMNTLSDDLPVPTDDGACDHLPGMVLPSIPLSSTDGKRIDLATLPGARGARRNRVDSAITTRSFDHWVRRLSSG